MAAKPIPDGCSTVTPYLVLRGGSAAIDYYKRAFGAVEVMRVEAPGGMLGHAEIRIGNSVVMLADEWPHVEDKCKAPTTLGGSPVCLHMYVEDCDKVFNQAIAAGGTVIDPMANRFYGDRSGVLRDPFGHIWSVGTHLEDLTAEEISRRAMQTGTH